MNGNSRHRSPNHVKSSFRKVGAHAVFSFLGLTWEVTPEIKPFISSQRLRPVLILRFVFRLLVRCFPTSSYVTPRSATERLTKTYSPHIEEWFFDDTWTSERLIASLGAKVLMARVLMYHLQNKKTPDDDKALFGSWFPSGSRAPRIAKILRSDTWTQVGLHKNFLCVLCRTGGQQCP